MPRTTNITCAFCGEIKPSKEYADRPQGKAPYCKECECAIFDRMESECGLHMALFSCCAAFNVPFLPLIIDKSIDEADDKWDFYQQLVESKGFREKDGKMLTFFDGGTNMLKMFGRQFDDKTTAHFIEIETQRIAALQGTPEQRARWGTQELMKDVPLTTAIYNELDDRYESRAADFKGTTLSAQQQDVLVKVTKWNFMIDKLIQKGQYPYAEKLQKMVQAELASECMRKTDEKPVEAMRLDATVDALEKAGLMENGDFLTYDETMQAFYDWCHKKKYDYTEDAANQMILVMQNAMRANADLPILAELDDDDFITDFNGEFAEEESEEERKAKEYAGLAPLHRKGEE